MKHIKLYEEFVNEAERVPTMLFVSDLRKYFSDIHYDTVKRQYDRDTTPEIAQANNGKWYEASSGYNRWDERVVKLKSVKAPKNESFINENRIAKDDEIKRIEHDIELCKKSKSANLRHDFNEIIKLGLKTIKNLSESNVDESVDVKYWATYNKDTSGQGNKEFANKSKDFEDTFEDAVVYWNQEADGAENRIKGAAIGKIQKMAKEFFKKEGWISVNVVQAMIMQDGAVTESTSINESTIQYFKPTVLDKKNAVDAKFFKKLMPRTSAIAEEAMEKIWYFEDSIMFVHYQYHIVKPNGNKINRPTYRLHQSQYWLTGAYDNHIKNLGLDPKEGVNVTLVTIFDITDPANEINLGKTWVDTKQFLDEMNRVFEVSRRES